MKNYPQIYDYKPLAGNIGDSVTTALLDAITKLARPHYGKDRFSTDYNWRIRLEAQPDVKRPNAFAYVLDAGQGYESCSLKKFKSSCEASGSVLSVVYCDNCLLFVPRGTIGQESGVFKVYAMTNGNIHECARQRWVTELASAYVEAVNSLDEHFMVVDAAAIRL